MPFNKREIIVPFFQVGEPEPDLSAWWEMFKDFRTVERFTPFHGTLSEAN